ncbi:MAG: PQQ-binding-like beta-propeller repeat protein [bacterium]|nr:PQQ-binding-like beta-propeller repeat protein [bacterium]
MHIRTLLLIALCGALFSITFTNTQVDAQAVSGAPCGIVDGVDLPLDISDTVERRFDDFARFRSRWGGNHAGIDLAFNREGEIVRASMRGVVTVSNPEEWDTELGVVVLEHTLPDNRIVYSLYGHIIQTDAVRFPPVGACVERGGIVGVIGDPSLSRPHLHYEIRRILAFEGGPGYVDVNPIELGWEHPLEFTAYWSARLRGLVDGSLEFARAPGIPPAVLSTGGAAVARESTLDVTAPNSTRLWSVSADSTITHVAVLPGDRIAVLARSGNLFTAESGRYLAQWTLTDAVALTAIGDRLLAVRRDGRVYAYSAAGDVLWEIAAPDSESRIVSFIGRDAHAAMLLRAADGSRWRLIDGNGAVISETPLTVFMPRAYPLPDGAWAILDGSLIRRIGTENEGFAVTDFARVAPPPGATAQITGDRMGNVYIYTGDSSGTLLAYAADGSLRWRERLLVTLRAIPPLLGVGSGCALFALDGGGVLSAIHPADGQVIDQVALYAGGEGTTQPNARLLRPFENDQVIVSAGFLSALLIDGRALAGSACVTG